MTAPGRQQSEPGAVERIGVFLDTWTRAMPHDPYLSTVWDDPETTARAAERDEMRAETARLRALGEETARELGRTQFERDQARAEVRQHVEVNRHATAEIERLTRILARATETLPALDAHAQNLANTGHPTPAASLRSTIDRLAATLAGEPA